MQTKQLADTKAKLNCQKSGQLTVKLSWLFLMSCLTACGTLKTSLPPPTVVILGESASVDTSSDWVSDTKAANEILKELSKRQAERLTEQQNEVLQLRR